MFNDFILLKLILLLLVVLFGFDGLGCDLFGFLGNIGLFGFVVGGFWLLLLFFLFLYFVVKVVFSSGIKVVVNKIFLFFFINNF